MVKALRRENSRRSSKVTLEESVDNDIGREFFPNCDIGLDASVTRGFGKPRRVALRSTKNPDPTSVWTTYTAFAPKPASSAPSARQSTIIESSQSLTL
ncbi:hypothetical protein [Burkholderia anthina]|uniref:hypothetical protein n=1 Tax=Burkholderia anthina TaxID=179879 RepID=UPI001589E423|nr:hypothetical protein [Burkholderia anthina]